MATVSILSEEMLIKILLLTNDCIGICRLVCKRWRSLVKSSAKRRMIIQTPRFTILSPKVKTIVPNKTLHSWAGHGYINLLQEFKEHKIYNAAITTNATRNGHLATLKWLCENDCSIDKNSYIEAAKHGYLDILEWLYETYGLTESMKSALKAAADTGRLEICKWLMKLGETYFSLSDLYDITDTAANEGHFEVVDWFIDRGSIVGLDTALGFIKHNKFEMLKQLITSERINSLQVRSCYGAAAKYNRLEILKWIYQDHLFLEDTGMAYFVDHDNINICLSKALITALEFEQIEILDWLAEIRFAVRIDHQDVNNYILTVSNEKLKSVKWLIEHDWPRPTSYSLCVMATNTGNIELLSLLAEHGFSVKDCLSIAIKQGNLDLMKQLVKYGEKITASNTYYILCLKNVEILTWVLENRYPIRHDAFQTAVSLGDLDLLRCLYRYDCYWDYYTANEACMHQRFDILEWLVKRGCPFRRDPDMPEFNSLPPIIAFGKTIISPETWVREHLPELFE